MMVIMRRWLIVVLFLTLNGLSTTYAQTNHWLYAYTMPDDDGRAVYTLDPLTLTSTKLYSIPFYSDVFELSQLYSITLSPDHRFALLTYDRYNETDVELVILDIATGQRTPIISSLLPIYKAAWSPDSTRIAYSVFLNDEGVEDIFIYDLAAASTQNITNDPDRHFDFAWSPTSDRIVIFSSGLVEGEWSNNCGTCPVRLEIYDLTDGSIQPAVDVDFNALAQFIRLQTSLLLCDLQWSPSGDYISLLMGCPDAYTIFYREVFIIDVAQSTLLPVTSFTGTTDTPRAGFFDVDYSYTWFDAQTFLIGASVTHGYTQVDAPNHPPANAPIARSYSFDTASNASTLLLDGEVAQSWAVNPVNGQIAFYTDLEPAIRIATFDGQRLNIAQMLGEGCRLNWSPDGALFVYATTTDLHSSCEYSSIEQLLFFDTSSEQTNTFSLAPNTAPIGWVMAEG